MMQLSLTTHLPEVVGTQFGDAKVVLQKKAGLVK